MDRKNETPSKSKNLMKVFNCDSPFRLIPNISTPPSRFSKILNPFEPHLVDRLHLPTFSPNVFAQVSTPKTDEKFKWTIDDISRVKPADIDEATISQHVSDHDPTIESLVQEKIDRFFNEKVVPSPFNEQIKQAPLIRSPLSPPQSCDIYTQTSLSLPPLLPRHVEEALAPYFNKSPSKDDQNSSLYRRLYESVEDSESVVSSPPMSTGLSPIQFSPEGDNKFESTFEIPQLKDCALSPIGHSSMSRSACRLNFSAHMSIDASIVVPDVNKSLNYTNLETSVSCRPLEEDLSDSMTNWDMEYKHVSILSKSPLSSPERIDSSNSDTPHSRIFTSQRKRLSHSFKDDQFDKDVEMKEDKIVPKRLKNWGAESGYGTGASTMCESSMHMFASTPTKLKN